LRIVDQAQHRLLLGQRGEKLDDASGYREPAGCLTAGQSEGGAESVALRARQGRQVAANRIHERMQPRASPDSEMAPF
jgi:hypothetical protein